MNDTQLLRYSRHILLPDVGIEGQERWLSSHVLLVGLGGLGSPVALYLAAAGVGSLTLADPDGVDITNLQRQLAHTLASVGQPKVVSAARSMAAINPEVHVVVLQERLHGERLGALVREADVVVDCSDNFATRHAVNAACVAYGKPLVSGAATGFDGQMGVYDTRHLKHPCYACVFPADSRVAPELCATMGVFAPLVGIIGSMQAAEVLKLLSGAGASMAGRLQFLDARTMQFTSIQIQRNPGCSVCAYRPLKP
jgi:molybdopterin-synthase adenylyltransferase